MSPFAGFCSESAGDFTTDKVSFLFIRESGGVTPTGTESVARGNGAPGAVIGFSTCAIAESEKS